MREIPRKTPQPRLSKLERAIAFISPSWGMRRLALGGAITAFTAYKGAEKSTQKGWLPGGGSADADTLDELPDLRERSRDLVRNNGIVAGIAQTLSDNIIGTGIKPQSHIDAERLKLSPTQAEEYQKQFEDVWGEWVNEADAAGRLDFYELQAQVFRQIIENGEAIAYPRMVAADYRNFKTACQLIEADRLATPNEKLADYQIRDGVELGEYGEPKNYYILKYHPGDKGQYIKDFNAYTTVAARDPDGNLNLLHLYEQLRPGQTRGVPIFAPIISEAHDYGEYMEAELTAARVMACLALFVRKTDPYGTANGSGTTVGDNRVENIYPGMIEYLAPGEDISTLNPQRPGGTFDSFTKRILRGVAAACGLPYELVAKDFSESNYSNMRAALLESRRFFRGKQSFCARRFCQPFWDRVLDEAFLSGRFKGITSRSWYENKSAWLGVKWQPNGWEWVDPKNEVEASILALQNNLTTLTDEQAKVGKDFDETIERRAMEKRKIAALMPAEPQAQQPGTKQPEKEKPEMPDDEEDSK